MVKSEVLAEVEGQQKVFISLALLELLGHQDKDMMVVTEQLQESEEEEVVLVLLVLMLLELPLVLEELELPLILHGELQLAQVTM